jgi:hypothetical protein
MDMKTEQSKKVGEDRAAMLERFHEHQGLEKSDVAPVAATASLDNASAPSKTDAPPVAEQPADTAEQVSVGQGEKSAPDAKVTEPEMVTVKALHAEREKRKEKTLEARKLAEEVAARDKVIAEMQARVTALEAKVTTPSPAKGDPKQDEVARQLAEENRRLKETAQKAAIEANRLASEKAQAELNAQIKKADSKLSSEGFPGFTRFTNDVYNVLVTKINAGELDEKDVTPAVWEEVYKNEVYPAIRKVFEAQVKQEKADSKLQQKKAASLVGVPGVAPEAPESTDLDAPQTPESYRKFRKTIK